MDENGLSSKAKSHYIEGCNFLSKKLYKEAIVEFKKALEIKPLSFESRYYLAKCYLITGDIDNAKEELKTLISQNPGHIDSLKDLGHIYITDRKYKEAIVEFKKAVELRPRNGELHYYLGNAYFFKGDIENALEEFNIAKEIDQDNNSDLFFKTGCILLMKGKIHEAVSQIKKSLEIKSDFHCLGILAFAYYLLEEKDKANSTIKEAISSSNNNPTLKKWESLIKKKIPSSSFFEKFRKEKSDFQMSFDNYLLGVIFAKYGKFEEAIFFLKEAIKLDKKCEESYIFLAAVYEAQNNIEESIKLLHEAIKINPASSTAHYSLAVIANSKEDLNLAKSEIEQAIKLDNENAEYYFLRGVIYDKMGMKEQAGDSWRKTLDLNPHHQEAEEKMKYYHWTK